MAKKMQVQQNDWQIIKTMVETDVIPNGLNAKQVVIRLFRWYTFEEQIVFDEAVKKIEQFLERHELYFSEGYVAEICNSASKQKWFKPLRKLETIKLYESDVQVIKRLPKQDLRKTYFAMMVQCKARKVQGSGTWDVLNDSIYQYASYCNTSCSRSAANEILYYLQQKGLIDVPLFELNKMYYTAPEESGKVAYEIDASALDSESLKQQFDAIFGGGKVLDAIMVIDLTQPQGYVIKHGRTEVIDYLVKELGVPKSKANDQNLVKILKYNKYAIDDFTFVKVLNEDEEWLLKAEKIQRSKQPYSRKICKQIPQTVMEGIMQYAKEFRNDGKIVWCVKKEKPQTIISKLKNKQK